MDRVLQEKLKIINSDANQYNETIYKRAMEKDVLCFENWWNKKLPDIGERQEFIDFIKEINGFDYDGLSFYSINEKEVNSFYESNGIYWENDNLKQYIFFGEDSISWYCRSLKTKQYFVLDKPSGTVIECFDSFDKLIIKALDSIL